MLAFFLQQLEFFGRIALAGLCGALIGYERKNRLKEAGPRTHCIVALAAALMMIVSKYGFYDLFTTDSIKLDPSRIAAQIVSGVGFLGAGVIFVRKQSISGLTTAAGIWGTAGVGMAIGAGQYIIGIAATLVIIFVQTVLHKDFRWFRNPTAEQLIIRLEETEHALADLKRWLEIHHIELLNMKTSHVGKNTLELDVYVKLPKDYPVTDLMDLHQDVPEVISVEF